MGPVFFSKPLSSSSHENSSWRWWINVWAPVAIAVIVITIESTATFSSQNTSSWLRPVVQQWFGAMSDPGWDMFHHYLRKSGHFLGYGTVGFTFLRAWLYTTARRGPVSLPSWRVESTVLAIFSTAIVASCDEYHQTLLPGRTGTPVDVMLDTAGACAMSLLVWLICWTMRAREEVW